MAVALVSLSGCWALLDIGDLGVRGQDGGPADAGDRSDVVTECTATPGRGNGDPPATMTCNGTPTDVLGSPSACGACGHDCAGGNCAAGVCSSTELFRANPNDELIGPELLDGGLWYTSVLWNSAGTARLSMTVNAWSDAGMRALATFPADPTILSALYDPPVALFYAGAGFLFGRVDDQDAGLALVEIDSYGFAVTSDHLYALRKDATGGSIVDIDRATRVMTPFADGQRARRFIVADDREVYWVTEPLPGDTAGEVRRRARTATSAVEPLLKISNPAGLALDATYLYFATLSAGSAQVQRVKRSGRENPETLSTLDDPALTATTWSALDVDGCATETRIWSRSASEDPGRPLYWLLRLGPQTNDLTVVEVPRCGGPPRRALFMEDVRTFSGDGPYDHFTVSGLLARGAR